MMDNNNWRPTPPGAVGGGGPEAALDGGDWRAQLPLESRERIVNKIMETLKRHLPVSGPEGLQELKKIAVRFEEKIYHAAISQSDYLGKISLKMLTLETKSQSTIPNALPSNSAGNSSEDLVMQSQIQSPSQPIPNSLAVNQPQACQQLLVQNIQNNVPSGVQASASLSSTLPSVSGLNQSSVPNTIGQNNNMQNMPNVSQNLLGNLMGQGLNSNMFVDSQRQRQQMLFQLQQSQNPQQCLYRHPYHQQLMKQKLQQGNIRSLMSLQFQQQQQQQQQQNMLQLTQLQPPQQSVFQTYSVMQPPSLSGLQQYQQSSVPQSTQSMLQQHQSLRQQQPQQAVHQQQAYLSQQPMLTSLQQQQQQHQLSSQQMMQQNQLVGQQNNMGEMQQQQQQRLLNQQNNLQNLQQQQQQLMPQQNNLANPQQMAPQTNVSGLNQQQQLVGFQSGNSSMQVGQHPVYVLQQSKVPVQQQIQGGTSNLLATQGQQSQAQPMQQQLMSQIQQQPAQLQQQVGLQQQVNLLQRDMHQRLQASGSLFQQQNVIDLKQLNPSQRPLSETSTMSIDSSAQMGHSAGGDWQEEAYQKMKSMSEAYLSELNEMYQKTSMKLQQHESLPQQPKSEQLEKLKAFKGMLQRIIAVLQVNKADIVPTFKEKLIHYEKQIINFINTSRPRKVAMQQGQLPPPHMHSMQQQQQSQPQIWTLDKVIPNSNMDSGQGNALRTMQQVGMGSMQQNPVSAPQQVNMSTMPQQGVLNMLQSNVNTHHSNSNMLQHEHLKQQQEQQMLQIQQLKQQYQQRQMQQQLKQQLLQLQQQQQQQRLQRQQQLQQAKQQLPSQLQTHQIPQLHQMNDGSDIKRTPGMGVKQGVFLSHKHSGFFFLGFFLFLSFFLFSVFFQGKKYRVCF